MQEQLAGFIRTAEALQIKGLAAVNSNNNVENLSLKFNDINNTYNNNNSSLLNNNNSLLSNNNNLDEFSKYSSADSKFRDSKPPLHLSPPAAESPPLPTR